MKAVYLLRIIDINSITAHRLLIAESYKSEGVCSRLLIECRI